MAKTVKSFPDSHGPGRPRKYPWDQWLDGQVWELTKGVDFTIAPNSMRSIIASAAGRKGTKYRSAIIGDKLYLQALYDD